jgi:hypothetical protein
MVKKYFYKIIIVGIVFLGVMFASRPVLAASIDIVSAPETGIYNVVLSVAPNESINAVEGSIVFDKSITVVPSIATDGSIVPLWVKEPVISGNQIDFSGVIPGGFSLLYDQFGAKPSTTGKLFSIIFSSAPNTDSYTFVLDSASVYLNDGRGTQIALPSRNITLPVSFSKNNLSGNNPTTNSTALPTSNSSSIPIIFVGCLFIFLVFCFYLIKKIRSSR